MLPGISQSKINFKDLIYYIGLLQKHLRLIALLMCVGLMLGLDYYVFKRPTYYAEAVFEFRNLPTPLDSDNIHKDSSKAAFINNVKRHSLVTQAAKQFGYPSHETSYRTFAVKHMPYYRVVPGYQNRFMIKLHAYNQRLAMDLPQTVVDNYLLSRQESREKIWQQAYDKYTGEIEMMNEELDEYYRTKLEFERDNQTTLLKIEHGKYKQIPQLLSATRQRLQELELTRERLSNASLTKLEKIAIIEGFSSTQFTDPFDQVSSLQSPAMRNSTQPHIGQSYGAMEGAISGAQTSAGSSVVVMPSMIDTEKDWEVLEKDLAAINRRLHEKITEGWLPTSYKLKPLYDEKKLIEEKIDVEYEIHLNRLDLVYANLQELDSKLEAKLPEYELVNIQREQLMERMRQHQVSERDFSRIQSRLYKNMQDTNLRLERDNVEIDFVGWNENPDAPLGVNKMKALITGLSIGLGLSIAVPFLLEYLDHTVTNLDVAEHHLSLKGLGIVPKIHETGPHTQLLLGDEREGRIMMENFRNVRCQLLFGQGNAEPPQSIMITSSCPREGKSFISSNLAASFAGIQEKVLLVDADLRRGRLDMIFGIKGRKGLKEVLRGEEKAEDVIYQTKVENLHLLPVGKGSRDTGSELLISNHLIQTLNDLRGQYDRIILDSPPVLGLSDTTVLQKAVDGVLMIISSNQTATADVKHATKWLLQNGGNILGFVLNKIDLSVSSNYYQYYYYSKSYYEDYSPAQIEDANPVVVEGKDPKQGPRGKA